MVHVCLGAATLNQTPLAWETNRRHIVAALDRARDQGVDILCLPELCISGYGCEDMFLSAGVRETALQLLADVIPETRGLFTSFGLPLAIDDHVYNAVAVVCDGQLLGLVCKQHLAGDGIHYEPRWFHPWPAGQAEDFHWQAKTFPIGDLLFDCGGIGIGFEICRDAWGRSRPAEKLARCGADLVLNPSASHFGFGKQAIRETFVRRAMHEFGVCFVYCNLLGNEAGRAIYDGGTMLAAGGEILARGPRFSFADVAMTTGVVDIEPRGIRQSVEAAPQRVIATELELPGDRSRTEGHSALIVHPPSGKTIHVTEVPPGTPQWETTADLRREELARAVPLALWDYLRKSRTRGFVVSLSGGADSSATAVMVHLMIRLAVAELGIGVLRDRLDYGGVLEHVSGDSAQIVHEVVHELLACVYQSTENSSTTTRSAARSVAESIGAEFFCWSVDDPIRSYVSTVSQAVGRQLNWERDDIALQNIQARARGPGVWLLANLRGALLLTTSNRSEAAVGYATMDGDTCGSLAPIAGVDKAFLREWLVWMEETGPAGLTPLKFLSAVNVQQPTAELRPASAGQTDEDDLMPYQVLDAIERAAIRDRLMPVAVLEAVAAQFPDFPPRQLAAWIDRFYRLWCRNQWKRERYAPSFHVDDENLDPRSWFRFPILSGGFDRELAQLWAYLEETK